MTNKKYHSIYLPLADIFELNGKAVFDNLSRNKPDEQNLVVVSLPLVNQLHSLKEKENSYGAEDTLEYLKQKQKQGTSAKNDFLMAHAQEGLDIAFFYGEQSAEKFIPLLEEKIRQNWKSKDNKGKPVLITSNSRDHILFGSKGIHVEEPKFLQVSSDIVYEGIIRGNDQLYAKLCENNNELPLEQAIELLERELRLNQFVSFPSKHNIEYGLITGETHKNNSKTRITGVDNLTLKLLDPSEKNKILRIGSQQNNHILGISPRDMEQYLAMQYGLLNPDITLFFLCGSQGSGKTLISYVCAVDSVLWYDKEERIKRMGKEKGRDGFYQQIILIKPNEIMGGKRRDVGALPGSLYQKLKPHLSAYIDAHRESILMDNIPFEDMLRHPKFNTEFGEPRNLHSNDTKIDGTAHLPQNREVIELVYSGFVRGRSFRDTILLIDEAQNFTPYEIKTIIERTGEGCKAIIMGDPLQVDNPYCSIEINGLTHAIKHYLDNSYTSLIRLSKNYRSQMSEDASDWRVYSQS